jgi:hypothetical protein
MERKRKNNNGQRLIDSYVVANFFLLFIVDFPRYYLTLKSPSFAVEVIKKK